MKNKLTLKPLVAALMLSSTAVVLADLESINQHQPNSEQIKQALNSNQLILAGGIFDPLHQTINFQSSGINNHESKLYGIVQFHPGKSNFQWLQKQGLQVIQSFSNHAFLVKWNNSDKQLLTQNSDIRWIGPFTSGYKVSPNLWQNNRAALTTFELSVEVFNGYPVDKIKHLIKKYAPEANFIDSNYVKSAPRIAIEIPAQHLDESLNNLAATEAVQWINLYYPERFLNNEAVAAVQDTSSSTSDTTMFDNGIYGSGQIIGVADSGMDHNEDWFAHYDDGSGVVTAITPAAVTIPPLLGPLTPNNKVIGYWVMPGAASYDHGTNHGTHTTGSVAGDESTNVSSPTSSGYDNDDGMAPNAQILFQDIGSATGLTGAGSSPMWQQAYDAGVRIHSNSYGSSTFGEYVSSDQNVDRSLRELDNMVIAIAAGNDDGFSNTTGSPGNAKSALTVGALGHGNSTAVAGFSNRGLTDDGRLKPDIAATGSSIQSAAGDTNDSEVLDPNPSRATKSGTSMSTPITAGATALLRQYFTDGFYPTGLATPTDAVTPSGQLMKAMLLNGSNTDSGFNSTGSGWGRPWLENTLYFNGDDRFFKFWDVTHESGLTTGESISFDVDVLAGAEFRATLVWYDVPGPTGSGVTLVNNLDLTVANPDGTYFGNVFSGSTSATGGSSDNINTVEQVRFNSSTAGEYNITVSAPNIPGDGSFGSDRQGYALVVSGNFDIPSLGGIDLIFANGFEEVVENPPNLMASDLGLSGVELTWDEVSSANEYEIFRSNGTCATMEPGSMRYISSSSSADFIDASTSGGYNYAYQVRAVNSGFVSQFSNCTDITSTQTCLIPPQFNATESSVANNVGASCGIDLTWTAASSNCPNVSDISYNIYRSTSHNFVTGAGNLLTTVNNDTVFSDSTVLPGQPYFYRIEAVNNGNSSDQSPELASTPLGNPSSNVGQVSDDADNSLLMNLSGTWSVSNDRSSNGTLSYRSTYEGANTYTSNNCSRMTSPMLSIPNSGTPSIDYQAWFEIEAEWDGVVVEISTDGGANWVDLPPVGGYPSDFSQTLNPPINGCEYPTTQGAFGGDSSNFDAFSHDLSAYLGDTVQIRWSFSTDPGFEVEGFYIDEINYNDINTFDACSVIVD
ncbi:MAG: S8 family serine peptidase [Marinicella sp.]